MPLRWLSIDSMASNKMATLSLRFRTRPSSERTAPRSETPQWPSLPSGLVIAANVLAGVLHAFRGYYDPMGGVSIVVCGTVITLLVRVWHE